MDEGQAHRPARILPENAEPKELHRVAEFAAGSKAVERANADARSR
jgi:hypothetical protein